MADGEVNLGLGQGTPKPLGLGDKPLGPPPLLPDKPAPVLQESPDVALHLQATEAYQRLILQPELEPLCAQYSATLQAADFQEALQALESVKGADQIALVARSNFFRQIDRLLIGADEILKKGDAVVFNFGSAKALHSLEEITNALKEIQIDMDRVKARLTQHLSGDKKDDIVIDLLHLFEKYMFDGKNLERAQVKKATMLIIKDPQYPEIIKTLMKAQILQETEEIEDGDSEPIKFAKSNIASILLPTNRTARGVLSKMQLSLDGDRTSGNFFLSFGDIPQTIILHAPSQDSFITNMIAYEHLLIDYIRLPYKDRPRIIIYTDGFTPDLETRDNYQSFLFCNTEDDLRNTIILSNDLAQEQARQLYDPSELSSKQKDAYDNSDLREWENITADTYQSLQNILVRFKAAEARGMAARTVLDLGTGEGRIAGMLARLGYKVIGMDISEKQLERAKERILQEGKGIRGEANFPGLSYHVIPRLEQEGLIKKEQILNDEQTRLNYFRVQESFFGLAISLHHIFEDWINRDRFPNHNINDFFSVSQLKRAPMYAEEKNLFSSGVGFDAAMFNWHTFCEVGSPENQRDVLVHILNVLNPGGELVIEIPDRNIEPYASALEKYSAEHPDEPYGTIRDPKPEGFQGLEGEGLYPPRYFPDVNELVLLLKSLGYEIDIKKDLQPYLIEKQNGDTKLTLKEYFITARKSKS